jgi:hypothetical protein
MVRTCSSFGLYLAMHTIPPLSNRATRCVYVPPQLGYLSVSSLALFPVLYLISALALLYINAALHFLVSLPQNPLVTAGPVRTWSPALISRAT